MRTVSALQASEVNERDQNRPIRIVNWAQHTLRGRNSVSGSSGPKAKFRLSCVARPRIGMASHLRTPICGGSEDRP